MSGRLLGSTPTRPTVGVVLGMSFGATAGTCPEPFDEAVYFRLDGYICTVLMAAKCLKNIFQITPETAIQWVRDTPKPFPLPVGSRPRDEAEQIARCLHDHGVQITLVLYAPDAEETRGE